MYVFYILENNGIVGNKEDIMCNSKHCWRRIAIVTPDVPVATPLNGNKYGPIVRNNSSYLDVLTN